MELQQIPFDEAVRILREGGKVFASPKVSHTYTRKVYGRAASGEESQELKLWIGDSESKMLQFKSEVCGIRRLHEGPFYSNAPATYAKSFLSHGHWNATEQKRQALIEAQKAVTINVDPRAVLRESPIQFTDYSSTNGAQGVALRKKFGGLNNQFLIANRSDNPLLSHKDIIALLTTYTQSFGFAFQIFPTRLIPNATTIRFGEYNIYVEDDKQ